MPKNNAQPWRPVAELSTLRQRAELLAAIRSFFQQRQVLEVETPILGVASVTDPHIESIRLASSPSGHTEQSWYLQTSPEFAMKRLLSAGSGDIYQIAHVFRQGEQGRFHHPEFTMLEWYRLGYDHHELMAEVEIFLQQIAQFKQVDKMTYAQAFSLYAGIEPHEASITQLRECAFDQGLASDLTERDQWLDLIMGHIVGPKLGLERPVFIHDFPGSQAALAKLNDQGFAERFELFIGGVEIANGYHELTDAEELLKRFEADNRLRDRLGLTGVDIDQALLAAMRDGLPACAGVAVGLDRLFMKILQQDAVAEVMSFTFPAS